jgi:hypothetical protein
VLSFLSAILCAIENLALSILAVITLAFNGLIVAVAGLLVIVFALLPTMPSQPPALDSGVLGTLNWFVNLSALVTLWGVLLGLWLVMLGIRVALRWLRAL